MRYIPPREEIRIFGAEGKQLLVRFTGAELAQSDQDWNALELAIDVSGEIDGKAFDGSIGLAAALAEHPSLRPCLARQTYRYLAGVRESATGQAEVIGQLGEDAGGKVLDLAVAIVESDIFRFFAPTEE